MPTISLLSKPATAPPDKIPSPYRGIHPFRYVDHKYFFGRDKVIESLFSKVLLYRLVLLFGESGAGKSSVINAGLIPRLEQEGFQAERLRVSPENENNPILIERISAGPTLESGYLPSIFVEDQSRSSTVIERIPCAIDKFLSNIRDNAGEPIPLLIFDQFEEFFTLFGLSHTYNGGDARLVAQRQIFDTIVEIANDQELHAKILIIIREDFLGKLDVYSKRYPEILDNRIRLGHLDHVAAKKAIVGPFTDHNPFPSRLTEELANTIIRELSADDLHGQVHATQLQIVCDQLWQQYAQKRTEITGTEFDQAGGVKGILEGYFTSELEKLESFHKTQAIQILGHLITDSDTRDIVSRDKLKDILGSQDEKHLDETLESLERLRIINRTQQRDNFYYEIASEYLIRPIKKEKQRLIENTKLKRQRRRSRWILVAVIMAGIVISIVSYKLHSVWQESQPWGYLNNLATGSIHPLTGNFASIGRSTEAISNTIDLKPKLVSRMHLWLLTRKQVDQSGNSLLPSISRDIVAIDMRSLNGTTINAEPLRYGDFWKLEDNDIIALAGVAPFRFSPTRISHLARALGWGIVIDGKSKAIHYLTKDRHVLSLNGQDKVMIDKAETADSFLAIEHRDGRITIRGKRTDRNLRTTMRLGDYTYVQCRIPPEREFAFLDVRELHRYVPCEALTGRSDLNDFTQPVHDLFTVTYTYGEVSFQIVQILPDLEVSAATH